MSPLARTQPTRWWFPTLVGYRRAWLPNDVLAGVAAGAVVIPQAMAYATIANLPVEVGLYTCMVPMLVYALLGGSRAMSTSTTSTIATLTATTLVSAGVASGSQAPLTALAGLTLLVGLFLLALRLLRLAPLVENISKPTVLGVQISVGLTVAVGQLPKLLGLDHNSTGSGLVTSAASLPAALSALNLPTVALSVGSIATVALLKRFAPQVPGTLLVLVGGILLAAYGGITEAGVTLIAHVPSGLPPVLLPSLGDLGAMIAGAMAIGMMVFIESTAVARSVRRTTEPRIDSARELGALAAANIGGAFFGSLPVSGGFSQSAVNAEAGARTQVSQLVTVAVALVVALFLGPVLSLLPQATLASLVFVSVLGLIQVRDLVRLARFSRADFAVALTTTVIGVAAGLLAAVGAGVALTLLLVLRELNVPEVSLVGRRGSAVAIRISKGMYTANVEENLRAVYELAAEEEPPPSAVVLDLDRMASASITVLDALEEFDGELGSVGVTLHLAAMPTAFHHTAEQLAWVRDLEAAGRVHASVEEGLQAASQSSRPDAPA